MKKHIGKSVSRRGFVAGTTALAALTIMGIGTAFLINFGLNAGIVFRKKP